MVIYIQIVFFSQKNSAWMNGIWLLLMVNEMLYIYEYHVEGRKPQSSPVA
jgi:hypothetical protein